MPSFVFRIILSLASASLAFAQDNTALINALIRKGVLTAQEAEEIRAELAAAPKTIPAEAVAMGKSTERLGIGMRLQVQHAHFDADTRGGADPASTQHFFLRRTYLTLRAQLTGNWGALVTYDFAGGGYDDAFIEWRPRNDLTFDFGLRKVNVAYEERASSGNLKSIERSGVTRYFVEANNGRRLGAASYRIGLFVDGRRALTSEVEFVYGAAVTSPERTDTFTSAAFAGDATSNRVALWADAGLAGKLPNKGTWVVGAGAGILPDQGGFGVAALGRGFDQRLYSLHADMSAGRFAFLGEYLLADVENGGATSGDARPRGFFLQPSLMLTSHLEAVIRYQWLDSDGRGLTLGDVVRSAPGGATMNTFTEWYAGLNWYLRGNDLKLQLGGVRGETKQTVTGAPASAEVLGVRSQMQLQF